MSGAEASYAKFSNSPLVRGDNSSFEPSLFNRESFKSSCPKEKVLVLLKKSFSKSASIFKSDLG